MRYVLVGNAAAPSELFANSRQAASASDPKATTASRHPDVVSAESQRFR